MILFPAVDIKNGKVVRLLQGKFDAITEYSNDPVSAAQKWESLGAQWLHVVDLDGAQSGTMQNVEWILKIAKEVKIPIQVGGGIRSMQTAEHLIQNGVRRVVLGTKVIEDQQFLAQLTSRWPERVAVSLDYSNGLVVTRGWAVQSQLPVVDFAKSLERYGLQYLISTNIAVDGTLSGPDFTIISELVNTVHMAVIASGGIGSIEDVRKLKTYYVKGLIGAITGKAIYEGRLDFQEALKVCSTRE